MLVPIWASIMLTYSRGALVIIPVLFVLILPFLRIHRQLLYVLNAGIAVAASIIILNPLTSNIETIARQLLPEFTKTAPKLLSVLDSLPLQSWLYLIGASVLSALVVLAIHHFGDRWLETKLTPIAQRKWGSVAFPLLIMGTGGLAFTLLISGSGILQSVLPASLSERLGTINFQQHSVLERFTFYRDAMKVVADYPLLGTGGGGWAALYEQYQNNPYLSRQAHSFYVQTLVAVGWIGFLLMMALLVCCYLLYVYSYIRHKELRGSHSIFFIFSLAILTHSIIDFDMSYLYLGSLVFFCMGAMIAPFKSELSIVRWDKIKNSVWRYTYSAVIVILATILFVSTYREYTALRSYGHAMYLATEEQKVLSELLVPLDNAISISPDQPEFTIRKIDWLNQAYRQTLDQNYLIQVQQAIQALKVYEPYNRSLILAEYRNFKDLKAYNNAVASLEEGISKFPWDINFYEAAIMEYSDFVPNTLDDPDTIQKMNRAAELYNEVQSRIALLATLPENQLQGRNFEVTPRIRQAMGKIYYFQNDYEKAVEILEPITTENLEDVFIRAGNRYYLAALGELGQKNENLENQLIGFYETAIIESSNFSTDKLHDPETGQKMKRGVELYNEVLSYNATLSKNQLEITPYIRQAVGKIYYYQNNFEEAVEILKPVISGNLSDVSIRSGIRHYLAALDALGQKNENLENQLINFSNDEKIALDALYNRNNMN
ncbi:O-antigen ligase family protein [Paenibacillus tarimensis]